MRSLSIIIFVMIRCGLLLSSLQEHPFVQNPQASVVVAPEKIINKTPVSRLSAIIVPGEGLLKKPEEEEDEFQFVLPSPHQEEIRFSIECRVIEFRDWVDWSSVRLFRPASWRDDQGGEFDDGEEIPGIFYDNITIYKISCSFQFSTDPVTHRITKDVESEEQEQLDSLLQHQVACSRKGMTLHQTKPIINWRGGRGRTFSTAIDHGWQYFRMSSG